MNKTQQNNQDQDKIDIRCEKDLLLEINRIIPIIETTATDWETRIEILNNIKDWVTGEVREMDNFILNLSKLTPYLAIQVYKDLLLIENKPKKLNFFSFLVVCATCDFVSMKQNQIKDLRSAVSQEACNLICCCCQSLGIQFQAISQILISRDSILQGINSANKVISENCHRCILEILENTPSASYIPAICDEINSQNPLVRLKASTYLLKIMESFNPDFMEKYMLQIENAISKMLVDASQEVRANSRETFYYYKENFPERAAQIFNSLEPAIKKVIVEKEAENKRPLNSLILVSGGSSVKSSTIYQSSNSINGSQNTPNQFQDKKSASGVPEIIEFETNTNTNSTATSLKFQSGNQKEIERNQSCNLNQSKNEMREDPEEQEEKERRSVKVQYPVKSPSLQNSGLKPPTPAVPASNQSTSTNASTINQDDLETFSRHYQKQEEESKQFNTISGSPSLSNKGQMSANSERNSDKPFFASRPPLVNSQTTQPRDQQTNYSALRSSTILSSEQQAPSTLTNSKIYGNSNEQMQQEKLISPKQLEKSWRDDDVQFLIDQTKHSDWATRESTFERINELIIELMENGEKITNEILSQLVESHMDRLSDSHYRVINTCQESLLTLISYRSDLVYPQMEIIIPKLLNNLSDPQQKVSNKANLLLNLIQKIYLPEKLIPSYITVLNQSTRSHIKIAALEVLSLLVKNSSGFFNHTHNLQIIIMELMETIHQNSSNSDIIMPCLFMLVELKEQNFNQTLHLIYTHPNASIVSSVRQIARINAPQLDDDLKRFLLNPNSAHTMPKQNSSSSSSLTSSKQLVDSQKIGQNNSTSGLQRQETKENYEEHYSTNANISSNNIQASNEFSGSGIKQKSREILGTISSPLLSTPLNRNSHKTINNKSNAPMQKNTISSDNKQGMKFNLDNQINKDQIEDVYLSDDIQKQLYQLSKNFEENQTFFHSKINHIIMSLIEDYENGDQNSLKTLQQIFIKKTIFPNLRPEVLQTTFACLTPGDDENDEKKVKLINQILLSTPHFTSLKALIDVLGEQGIQNADKIINFISYVVTLCTSQEIIPLLDHIIQLYLQFISDPCPDVRKAIVFCMAELSISLGKEIQPYLQLFSQSQQNLILYYVDQRKKSGPLFN